MPYKDHETRNAYMRNYYYTHREKHIRLVVARTKRNAVHVRELLTSLKVSCSRCGYDKCVDALDFHHTDNSTKDRALSEVSARWSDKRILEEVAKCVVLCANCHREEHSTKRKRETDSSRAS